MSDEKLRTTLRIKKSNPLYAHLVNDALLSTVNSEILRLAMQGLNFERFAATRDNSHVNVDKAIDSNTKLSEDASVSEDKPDSITGEHTSNNDVAVENESEPNNIDFMEYLDRYID